MLSYCVNSPSEIINEMRCHLCVGVLRAVRVRRWREGAGGVSGRMMMSLCCRRSAAVQGNEKSGFADSTQNCVRTEFAFFCIIVYVLPFPTSRDSLLSPGTTSRYILLISAVSFPLESFNSIQYPRRNISLRRNKEE